MFTKASHNGEKAKGNMMPSYVLPPRRAAPDRANTCGTCCRLGAIALVVLLALAAALVPLSSEDYALAEPMPAVLEAVQVGALAKSSRAAFRLVAGVTAVRKVANAVAPTTIRHAVARAPILRRRTSALSDDLDDAATRAHQRWLEEFINEDKTELFKESEETIKVAMETIAAIKAEKKKVATIIADIAAPGPVLEVEQTLTGSDNVAVTSAVSSTTTLKSSMTTIIDQERWRFKGLAPPVHIAEPGKISNEELIALGGMDEVVAHHVVYAINEYPVGVPLHRPAEVEDAFNSAVHELAIPVGLPAEKWAIDNGQRQGCSRRCSAVSSCVGFAWERLPVASCVFYQIPGTSAAAQRGKLRRAPLDRMGNPLPGGLELKFDSEWSWFAKPTQESLVDRFFRSRFTPAFGRHLAHRKFGPDDALPNHPSQPFSVFWMNLKTSTERRAGFEREVLEKHQLKSIAHRVEAINFHGIASGYAADMFAQVGLDPFPCNYRGVSGNLALLLTSHVVWRSMLRDTDHWWYLWFEDDARIHPKVKHFQSAVAELIHDIDVADATRMNSVAKMCVDGDLYHGNTVCVARGKPKPEHWTDRASIRPCVTPRDVDCTVGAGEPTVIWMDTRSINEDWWEISRDHNSPDANQAGMLLNRPAALVLLELHDPHSRTMVPVFSKRDFGPRFVPGGLWHGWTHNPSGLPTGPRDCINDWFLSQWAKNGAFQWGVRPWVVGSSGNSDLNS